MANKRAEILTNDQLEELIAFAVQRSRVPESDRLKLLLSFKGGLRACEIARIKVFDMVDASNRPARMISVFSSVSKGGKQRAIPMHPDIRQALLEFQKRYPTARYIALSPRKRRGRPGPMTANAVAQWFFHLYRAAGFKRASSHSGRRTFATRAASKIANHHMTLVDVQKLLGHARLDTTARYIEPSADTFALVEAL